MPDTTIHPRRTTAWRGSQARAWDALGLALILAAAAAPFASGANYTLLGWSDLGIHENDGSDFSVYSLTPPYSTIHAQFISGGFLVTNNSGVTITYEAVAEPGGSINTTSVGKGNFFQYAQSLLGVALAPDQGLAGFAMPGPANRPQLMSFAPTQSLFLAEGIPLLPYDDRGKLNHYPLFRLVARDTSNNVLASTQIVLPVSDEMDCRSCHGSGSQTLARPQSGWTWDLDPVRDYKLNVLSYHDNHHWGSGNYTNILVAVGYNPSGLVASVVQDGKPVLCVRCHASNALPGSGAPGMRPLTTVMHTLHGSAPDPVSGVPLAAATQSSACLRCHAGPESLRVRGAHHQTVNPDGSVALQCQNCHGTMGNLVAPTRQGWLDEPQCQSCHTGTAVTNNGLLRYTSAFEPSGLARQATNATYATQPNTPAQGFSLYRSSAGHGGIMCEACHGSTHAELPSTQPNDEVQGILLQGHGGVLLDCTACHTNVIDYGGPHGMHSVDLNWARSKHHEGNFAQCRDCHGLSFRGTVLSRAQADRAYTEVNAGGPENFWRGFQTGCYACHLGPSPSSASFGTTNKPPVVSNLSTNTIAGSPLPLALTGSDANGDSLTYRIVSQPAHGTVALVGDQATYYPADGFVGPDSFTFAANDKSTDSDLATATVQVQPGPCLFTLSPLVPRAAFPTSDVPFRVVACLTQCLDALSFDWDFGDGSVHGSSTNQAHRYPASGDYTWTLIAQAGGVSQTNTGTITISPTLGPPLHISLTLWPYVMTISWPADPIPTTVETSYDLNEPYWQPVWDAPYYDPTTGTLNLDEYEIFLEQYFRLRRVP